MENEEEKTSITIERKKKKDKKKKDKNNKKKNAKPSDIVSCITFLSKDQKRYSKKEQIYSDDESSDDSDVDDISRKRKKKDKYMINSIFQNEKKSKKIISEDLIISDDKKYIYEDELNIEKTDSIILNGKIYNDVGTLELHIFNYDESIFNIYDDTIIDNYPLCMDVVNSSYYKNTNLVAIGTLDKNIGLWDIHSMDSLEPVCYLGSQDNIYDEIHLNGKKKKKNAKNKKKRKVEPEAGQEIQEADEAKELDEVKEVDEVQEELQNDESVAYENATIGDKPSSYEKKKKKKKYKNELQGHTDSVTCINISKIIPNLLCSGSKDHTIKLWDLSSLKILHTFDFHNKKINNLNFHENDTNLLLSTSSDKTLKIYDIRKNQVGLDIELDSTPESTIWSKANDYTIYSTDIHGYINKIDIRNAITTPNCFNNKDNIVKFKAFDTSCISLLNLECNTNLALAGSEDGIIKAFDFSKFTENDDPPLIYTRNVKKNLFFMKDNSDWSHVIFFGCDNLYDWDLKECEEIRKHFKL
ncbi:periodic tryptophan protein 1, putative [Plasmodium vinckei vinckei]|uniref:Periodic tryptophan protein 1, putative n=1 Tax=Plasmodium vinckei vinckei TaxID=54757 RepID=A0A449C0T0_PLAVN|nr:periodic tryptophan protein 1, putative [Plasmodium vinckei vinckei]VEV59299.1 periodic tryptophan protein 1, putative [Plasmodium vinckei vinckei]